jgi:hypothetical protein
VGLAQYVTVLVQWFVMHERHLAGSMIDDEFEFMLSVVPVKRCM